MRAATALILAFLMGAAGCRRDVPFPADGRVPVWLDLSPSYGDPPADPGDALALVQAYGSGQLAIRGVSITYGHVPLVRGYPVAQELFKRIDTGLLRPWRGASAAEERAAPTEATELLDEALGREKLTILSLGPATTVASVLLRDPSRASRIERVVLVETTAGADRGSLQVLVDAGIPLTLVANDVAEGIRFSDAEFAALAPGQGAFALVLPTAQAWAQAREGQAVALPALLAVDLVAHPRDARCENRTDTTLLPGRPVSVCRWPDEGPKARILRNLSTRR